MGDIQSVLKIDVVVINSMIILHKGTNVFQKLRMVIKSKTCIEPLDIKSVPIVDVIKKTISFGL
tara:strand:- start:1227 stop:1418 length:192 start_codon:yes stop_codon:yes gene_type:complete